MPTNPVSPHINTGQVALMLGVSNVQISQLKGLVDDPLPFVGKQGREFLFDIHAVHEWDVRRRIRQHYRGTKTNEDDTEKVLNFTEEKSRLTKAQADEKELAVAEKRGELIPIVQVAKVFETYCNTVRAGCLSLPAELGRACPELSSSGLDVIRRTIAKTLNGLKDQFPDPNDIA